MPLLHAESSFAAVGLRVTRLARAGSSRTPAKLGAWIRSRKSILKYVALKVRPVIHSCASMSKPAVQLRARSTVRPAFFPDSTRTEDKPVGEALSERKVGITKFWLVLRSESVGARMARPQVPRNATASNGAQTIPNLGVAAWPKSL